MKNVLILHISPWNHKLFFNLWTLSNPKILTKLFSSVAQSCQTEQPHEPQTLCNLMNHSTPGLPVHHQLPEFTQTHVHRVDDAIQPSHPLSSPSPPAFNLSQHQGLFQWVSSSQQVAKNNGVSASASVLPMNIQGWYSLGLIGLISLQSKWISRVFSNTTDYLCQQSDLSAF